MSERERTDAERRLEELNAAARPEEAQHEARPAARADKGPGLLRRTGIGIRRFYRVWIQSDDEARNPRVSDIVTRDNNPWD